MKYITFYLKIIYDSVAAGAGFGMFITLSILFLVNDINYTDEVKILAAIISFILIISGLVLSIILRINNKNIFATKKTFWISLILFFAAFTADLGAVCETLIRM